MASNGKANVEGEGAANDAAVQAVSGAADGDPQEAERQAQAAREAAHDADVESAKKAVERLKVQYEAAKDHLAALKKEN